MTARSATALRARVATALSAVGQLSRAEWHHGAVIYQVYLRSFLDTDGNGIGDLEGVSRSLDYIASLGVDAIWICPFFTSPMKDFGYDIADYRGVDPMFGTPADFDRLVVRAHERGLKVIIDQVWAHSSDAHPWFADSRHARGAAKADWYVWADPKPDGSPPNNWLSVFGGSAWSWEPRRRQYYLHHFLGSQPALNLRHPAVVDELHDTARFWLDRGVDGFRLDAIDFMFHDPLLRDNPARAVMPSGTVMLRPFAMQEHRHDMLHPDVYGFLERVRGVLSDYPGAVSLGEISSEPGAFERCADYTDRRAGRLDMAYTLALMKRQLRPGEFAQVLQEAERVATEGCLCWAFSNHDVVRAPTRWGAEDNGEHGAALSRMLIALLLSLPGAACLYQGEELGLPEAEVPHELMVDPYGLAFYPSFKGRDGARTPMPWQASAPAAGFSATRPWLPVDRQHQAQAVDRQASDRQSVLSFARRFIQWRKEQPALTLGNARALTVHPQVFAMERAHGGERVLALFNFAAEPVRIPPSALPSLTALSGHGFDIAADAEAVSLPPYGAWFARLSA
jgi:alpha-glucosidase